MHICCGNQPPKMAPMIPTSWWSHPCLIPSHIVIGLVSVTCIRWRKWWYYISEIGLKKTVPSFFVSVSALLWISYSRLSQLPCHEDIWAVYLFVHKIRKRSLWLKAREELRHANNHVSEFRIVFPIPFKPCYDHSPSQHFVSKCLRDSKPELAR